MKKILSFILTVAMLASMVIIPAGADAGNAAFYFDSVTYTGDMSKFKQGYIYADGTAPDDYLCPDPNTGGYDYTMVFDLNVDSYVLASDCNAAITFTGHFDTWNCGYSFQRKSFYVSNVYFPTADPNVYDPLYVAEVGYDLKPGTWYEIGVKFQGRALSLYVNGVKMFTYDTWNFNRHNVGYPTYAEQWEAMRVRGNLPKLNWIIPVNCAFYADNLTIYSGDYDFGTGTASKIYTTANDGLVSKMNDLGETYSYWGPFCVNTPCGYQAPDGGTEKVTYDRAFAASHTTHNLVLDEENSKTVTCTTDGYDLYACECGASEQKNYQKAPGHNNGNPLGGRPVATIQEPTATDVGVKTMICQVCRERYTEVFPLTGTDKGLRLTNNGMKNIFNGYLGVGKGKLMLVDDGFYVSMDIMPISHRDNENARIGAYVGSQSHDCYMGYDFTNSCFYVEEEGTRVATAAGTLENYKWNEWAFRRVGKNVTLYIDGVSVISYTMSEDVYNFSEGSVATDAYMFLVLPCQTDLLLDNLMLAGPDYDERTNSGVIYEYVDFTDVKTDSMYISSSTGNWNAIVYNDALGAGYSVGSYGRPAKSVTPIHREMSIYLDCGFEEKSENAYATFVDNDAIKNAYEDSSKDFNLEYSFDFNVTDWCTDSELLGGGTAMIGSHVNTRVSNGFAGYDFLRQEFIIGDLSSQAGGNYTTVYASVAKAIGKNEWHRLGVKYFVPANGDATITITLDGAQVLTYTYDDELAMEYLIMYPNFIKGYIDNVSTKLNTTISYTNVDFFNAFDTDICGFNFTGTGYKLVDAPADDHRTHIYSETVYPASCTAEGHTVYTCSCGESTYTRYNQPVSGHSWDEGVIITPATSTSTGLKRYTCTVCQETKDEILPMEKPDFIIGDANGDGVTDTKDATAITRRNSGWSVSMDPDASDVNGDGTADNKDALAIRRKNSGWSIDFVK